MIATNVLQEFTIFEGLKKESLDKLAEISELKTFKAGEYLKKAGEMSKYFYVIKTGKVAFETEIFAEKTARIGTADAQEYFGESSLIPPHQTSTSRLALVDSEVLVIDGEKMKEMFEKDHHLGYFMMCKVAEMMATQLHRSQEALLHCHWG